MISKFFFCTGCCCFCFFFGACCCCLFFIELCCFFFFFLSGTAAFPTHSLPETASVSSAEPAPNFGTPSGSAAGTAAAEVANYRAEETVVPRAG